MQVGSISVTVCSVKQRLDLNNVDISNAFFNVRYEYIGHRVSNRIPTENGDVLGLAPFPVSACLPRRALLKLMPMFLSSTLLPYYFKLCPDTQIHSGSPSIVAA